MLVQVRLLQLADKAAGQKGFLDCGAGLCQWPAYRIPVQVSAIHSGDVSDVAERSRWKVGRHTYYTYIYSNINTFSQSYARFRPISDCLTIVPAA